MRSPGRSSVCDCAPSPINSGRVEIVTPDCRTNYLCRSSLVSDRLSGAALVSQRRSTTGRPTTSAPRTAVRCGAPLCRCCSRAGPGRVAPRGSAIRRARPRRPRAWRGRARPGPASHGRLPRLTSGRATTIRSASAKCSPAAALGGWVFMGRTSTPVKAPVWCSLHRPGPPYWLRLPSVYPKLRRSRTVYTSTRPPVPTIAPVR